MKKNIFYSLIASVVLLFCFNATNIKAQETLINNTELGYFYTSEKTIFKLASSTASKVIVVVDDVDGGTKELIKDNNVWMGYVPGDLVGKEYSFIIEYEDNTKYENVLDPYGRFINSSATRNTIVDETSTSFSTWEEQIEYLNIRDQNKIIYGIDVQNFTKHISWNGIEENRGKLLGLIESNTKYNSMLTGYDYVKNLGITYIELSDLIDKENPFRVNQELVTGIEAYSGSLELKRVVNGYYTNNIGVIMSFDYENLSGLASNLAKIDTTSYLNNENELDLSKDMTQKYIEDLLIYYVTNYKLSGIKIENMSDYTVSFINQLSEKLKMINENIIIYGDGSYDFEEEALAGENNLEKLTDAKMINGSLSYALFGSLNNKDEKGILEGNYSNETIESLKFAFLSGVDNGQIDYSSIKGISYKGYWGNTTSYQIVNYIGARNGLSIYDRLMINNLTGENILKQKVVLAVATMMVSGGIPYIYSGEELLASYMDVTNSKESVCTDNSVFCFHVKEEYKSIDWANVFKNEENVNAVKSLINYRKTDTGIMQSKAAVIKNNVSIFLPEEYKGVIGFTRVYPNAYTGDVEKVFIAFNYSNNDFELSMDASKGWKGLYNYNNSKRDGGVISLKANSLYSEYKNKQPKVNSWITLIFVVCIIGGLYYANILLNKKLVEKKGYDIKEINKKYRPFIKRGKNKEDSEIIEENKEQEENSGEKENGDS